VDYQAQLPAHQHLATKYSRDRFDVILDCIGVQSLYTHSPNYLKEDGIYVNIGGFEGLLWTAWCWFVNTWRPAVLGGVPRKYCMFSTVFDQETSETVAQYVADGKLRTIVSEVLKMEDVLKVC
jgi:NADPH:quinone reductase-like Zn-dependent oxidoreductase